MTPNIKFVAAAILAFCAPALATSCTATVTVTITETSSVCDQSTSRMNSSMISTTTSDSTSSLTTSMDTTSIPTSMNSTMASTWGPEPTPLDCQEDNCLRAFIGHPSNVSPFCATFMTSFSAATTGFPDSIENCEANPSRISSACSCVNTALISSPTPSPTPGSNSTTTTLSTTISNSTTSPPPASTPFTPLDCQPDNCLRHFERFPEISSFCQTYTTSPSSATAFPPIIENCDANPSRVSSACSCINTELEGAIGYTPTTAAASSTTQPFPAVTGAPDPATDCHQDNCLREFFQSQDLVSEFCSTYTTATNTATVSLPMYASTTMVGGNGGMATSASASSSGSACGGVIVVYETRTMVNTVVSTVGLTSADEEGTSTSTSTMSEETSAE
ncbi:hypothetical protein BJ875DRAFT_442395 [Amylocarpus encephaloides]|uniref:Extracellular membrane protein CFEM domain-containing protein n=1 Tax=Amylocarpus encephaloides TaxID=45428 RepID=A0A9P7YGQ3_9HELO|nr:hypothetical protein BJ875DRAFT_442395 [Amylocarpus encephaloides]